MDKLLPAVLFNGVGIIRLYYGSQQMESNKDPQISLQEITQDTFWPIIKLKVTENQMKFVASNAISIAEASFSDHAWYRAIYADNIPVGFVMLHLDKQKKEYWVWRFMIDEKHQSKGYGRLAMHQVIQTVQKLPGAMELLLSYVPGDGDPSLFYQKIGFIDTGEWEDDEKVMKLDL
jgi:diamine N-acetyltransferase